MTATFLGDRAIHADSATLDEPGIEETSGAAWDPTRVTAGDLMSSPVAVISADESLWLAALRLETEPHSHLVVLDDRRPVGVIDQGILAQSWPLGPFTARHRAVGQITPGRVHTVLPEVSAARVASIMLTDGVDVVPVVDRRGNAVGLVTARQLIRLVAGVDVTDTRRAGPRRTELG